MALPLRVAGVPKDRAAENWNAFVRRRDALVSRMEIAVCDGCDGCGLRCMEGFKVTCEEDEAARAYLKTQPPDEVARVLGQEKTVPWPGAEDSGVTVTYCRFRDMEKRNCFLYPARPTVCRLFGHTPWLPCPIEAVPRVPEGSPEIWGDYIRRERRTWSEWDAKKNGGGIEGGAL